MKNAKMQKIFSVLILCLALSACAGFWQERKIKEASQWVGVTEQRLLADWGVPDRVFMVNDDKFIEYGDGGCKVYFVINANKVARSDADGTCDPL